MKPIRVNYVDERPDTVIIEVMTLASWKSSEVSERYKNWLQIQRKEMSDSDYFILPTEEGVLEKVILVVDENPLDRRSWIWLGARMAMELPSGNYKLDRGNFMDGSFIQLWELGWGLASYQFTKYKERTSSQPVACLVVNDANRRHLQRTLEGIFLTRDLINTPAQDLGPQDLAQVALDLANTYSASVKLLEGDLLQRENYPSVFAVGKGSARPPILIDLNWGEKEHPLICLVGKGVVFDSGGLNLKPERGMLLMKKDMGGAAIVLGLAKLIMDANLPVRLRVLIPAVENMVSGDSFRPGDVIKTRKGLSVEITNTDAEGRVVLSDALFEAVSVQPDLVIDVATLTGACRVALGEELPGYFTPSEELAAEVEAASLKAVDPVWRLPLWNSYRMALRSTVADLNNSPANGMGGAINAALFLKEFVGDFKNWLHLDAYGWVGDAKPGYPVGGEATALRALYQLISDRYCP